MRDPDDLIAEILVDHHHLGRLVEEVARAADRGAALAATRTLAADLQRHELAEEVVVEPLLERLPEGPALVVASRGAGLAMSDALSRLGRCLGDDHGIGGAVREAIDEVARHLHEEEGHVLPLLQRRIGIDELRHLGPAFRRVRRGPTGLGRTIVDRPPCGSSTGVPTGPSLGRWSGSPTGSIAADD